ncbi:aminoglycoside N(3)-acetyltransferase [Floccifex sp.]|uniref:aminoglycoside N(3)-acetyltransferase n=1 Tax=Floccifex sp. TaxID=2815810 RepID=UPI003EFC087F
MKPILKNDIQKALLDLGIQKGWHIIVHTSLSSIGYVCGGAQVIIEALLESVGKQGTIVMPSQSWKNLDPETGVHWDVSKEDWDLIRENWPAYQKEITPTNTMGTVAEMFRTWPGTLRSNHPARSFCANGKMAKEIIENHTLSNIFTMDSPLGKLYELDGYVLLIGVDYDKNTSLHLADTLADYPSKHNCIEHSAIFENGKRVWKAYETLYVDGNDFIQIGKDFEQSHVVKKTKLGKATCTLMSQRELVDFATFWIEQNRN